MFFLKDSQFAHFITAASGNNTSLLCHHPAQVPIYQSQISPKSPARRQADLRDLCAQLQTTTIKQASEHSELHEVSTFPVHIKVMLTCYCIKCALVLCLKEQWTHQKKTSLLRLANRPLSHGPVGYNLSAGRRFEIVTELAKC